MNHQRGLKLVGGILSFAVHPRNEDDTSHPRKELEDSLTVSHWSINPTFEGVGHVDVMTLG